LRLIEPETVGPGALDDPRAGAERRFFATASGAAYQKLPREPLRRRPAHPFDIMCFGEALPRRSLDPRVVRAIAQIGRFCGEPVTAASCAAEAGLSSSRFLHLFKQETGIAFRAFRAWKRARHLLHFANQDLNLAHLAQDIGYPDSTHFSHSIRRFYGLKPRAIFSGSRDLAIRIAR
jgi:AraC-like DNA-binding protein